MPNKRARQKGPQGATLWSQFKHDAKKAETKAYRKSSASKSKKDPRIARNNAGLKVLAKYRKKAKKQGTPNMFGKL